MLLFYKSTDYIIDIYEDTFGTFSLNFRYWIIEAITTKCTVLTIMYFIVNNQNTEKTRR